MKWLNFIPPALTLKTTFCPQGVFMCLVISILKTNSDDFRKPN